MCEAAHASSSARATQLTSTGTSLCDASVLSCVSLGCWLVGSCGGKCGKAAADCTPSSPVVQMCRPDGGAAATASDCNLCCGRGISVGVEEFLQAALISSALGSTPSIVVWLVLGPVLSSKCIGASCCCRRDFGDTEPQPGQRSLLSGTGVVAYRLETGEPLGTGFASWLRKAPTWAALAGSHVGGGFGMRLDGLSFSFIVSVQDYCCVCTSWSTWSARSYGRVTPRCHRSTKKSSNSKPATAWIMVELCKLAADDPLEDTD